MYDTAGVGAKASGRDGGDSLEMSGTRTRREFAERDRAGIRSNAEGGIPHSEGEKKGEEDIMVCARVARRLLSSQSAGRAHRQKYTRHEF